MRSFWLNGSFEMLRGAVIDAETPEEPSIPESERERARARGGARAHGRGGRERESVCVGESERERSLAFNSRQCTDGGPPLALSCGSRTAP